MKIEYYEYSSPSKNSGKVYEIEEILFSGKSDFQKIDFFRTKDYGVLFSLDNIVQMTEKEEFFYHEMIVHPACMTHPSPKNILIIGGGDCGTLFQLCKYDSLEKIDMVEIDRIVIEQAKIHLPNLAGALNDHRVNLTIGDGFAYLDSVKNRYDIIIVDSTDPDTIATELFTGNFYESVSEALNEDGIFVCQSEPPFHDDFNKMQVDVYKSVSKYFSHVNFLLFPEPMYPTGYFSCLMGSKVHDPRSVSKDSVTERLKSINRNYYNADIHYASLAVPEFMKKKLGF